MTNLSDFLHKEYVSIEYPGNVINFENCLETLGGLEEVRRVCSQEDELENKKPLELRLWPKNQLEHPIQARSIKICNLLLQLKKEYSKDEDGKETHRILEHKVIGVIKKTYRFRGEC